MATNSIPTDLTPKTSNNNTPIITPANTPQDLTVRTTATVAQPVIAPAQPPAVRAPLTNHTATPCFQLSSGEKLMLYFLLFAAILRVCMAYLSGPIAPITFSASWIILTFIFVKSEMP